MKKIEGVTAEEKKMIVSLLENPPREFSTTIKDFRQISKICTLIEASGDGDLPLEDADYEYIKQRLVGMTNLVPRSEVRGIVIAVADKLGIG